MPHGAALFRIWAAMRELANNSPETLADPVIAAVWDRSFGLWASNASWFWSPRPSLDGPLGGRELSTKSKNEIRYREAIHCKAAMCETCWELALVHLYSIAQLMERALESFATIGRRWRFLHRPLSATLRAYKALFRSAPTPRCKWHALARYGRLWSAYDDLSAHPSIAAKSWVHRHQAG